MEKVKWNMKQNSLRTSFMYAVLRMVLIVLALAGITIWCCASFQNWLLPESDYVYLTMRIIYPDGTVEESSTRMKMGEAPQLLSELVEFYEDGNTDEREPEQVKYSVEKIENSFSQLTPKRKLAYRAAGISMIFFPILYSVIGIILCAAGFYRKKLKQPIGILSDAAEQISRQNLDFHIAYESKDEMGILCASFEKMRQALYENNRALWASLEEGRKLQASVSHDLRNPIAIILGYTEYLEMNVPKNRVDEKQLLEVISNISQSAKRVEHYTDSIRDINHLEELETKPKECSLEKLTGELEADFRIFVEQKGFTFQVHKESMEETGMIDQQVLYRILENIISNAVRFAGKQITMNICTEKYEKKKYLIFSVLDDGPGFPEKILNGTGTTYYTIDKATGHMGMGLSVSRILSKKHGGELTLENQIPHGAAVIIKISYES